MMIKLYSFLFIILFIAGYPDSFAQPCTGPPGVASNNCSTPGAIPLTEGANINTGQEYFFTGTGTFFSVSVNGGRLRICGDLTLSNLNFNQGEIIIEETGSLSYGGSVLTQTIPNQKITNYGELTIQQNYILNTDSYLVNYGTLNMGIAMVTSTPVIPGSPDAFLVNGPGGQINLSGLNATLNSAFINRGITEFGSLTINGTGSICMGQGSAIITDNITNNRTGSVAVEAGTACISYNGQALMNNDLSSSSTLFICRQPGSQDPSPNGFGAAQVIDPCTSCLVVLPVSLVSFTASSDRNQCLLRWVTGSEDNVHSFIIESSYDAINFRSIGEQLTNNRPSTYEFRTELRTRTFFRLKILGTDGSFTYSRVVQATAVTKNTELVISPNPAQSGTVMLSFVSSTDEDGQLFVIDMTGRRAQQQSLRLRAGVTITVLSIEKLPAGIYEINFRGQLSGKTARLVKPK